MASKKAGLITVQFTAGTGQFGDVEKARATVRNFGTSVKGMNAELHGTVTGVQATSGALRVLEGGVTNNLRAAERFTANVLGLGPALVAAFPVVGAIAFLGILDKLGTEAYKFVDGMRTSPEKMSGAWRALSAPMKQANDELAVANDRLSNEIAKLEGKRQNTLKLSLDEARLAADKLGDSLEADLQKAHKFLEENDQSIFKKLLTGEPLGSDWGGDPLTKQLGGFTGAGGFNAEKAGIMDRGNEAIAKATSLKEKDAAQTKLQTELLAAYDRQLQSVNVELVKRFEARMGGALPMDKSEYNITGKEGPEVERALAVLGQLRAERARVVADFRNQALTATKDALTANASNAELDRPFEDRMKAMGAQLEGIKIKMAATGQGEGAEVLAKSFASAQAAIEEVNRALERRHTKLTANQEDQIRNREFAIADAEAEAAWKTKLDATTDSIENRIRSMQLLTVAIGRGYEATKQASVETSVMGAVPKGAYTDQDWMSKNQATVSGLRSQFAKEYDAEHAEQTGKAVYALQQQIDLEKSLAKVQAQGAEAVRLVTLAYRLKKIALENDTESAKKLMQAEIALYTAERDNRTAADLAKINEETEATRRLTAAVFEGAEAARKAGLENKYAQMQHAGAAPEVIAATRTEDEAKHQEQLATEAAKLATNYTDALAHISELTAKLQEAKATQGDTLGIETALRNLENERLHILAEQSLQMGRAQDGVHAFFLDMQQSAKTAADTIYEAMHSAFDKASNELANLLTGQKTSWSKLFIDLGHEIETNAIKGGLQTVLGKLAKPDPSGHQTAIGKVAGALGIGAAGKPDGSTADRAIWVRMANAQGNPITGGPAAPSIPGGRGILFGNGGLLGTGGVPTVSEQSGGGQSSSGDTTPADYDQYGFRRRPDVPSVFLPPFPSQDIGPAGSGKIGDIVGSGDTLAGLGGDFYRGADSPFMNLPGIMNDFTGHAIKFGKNRKKAGKPPGWLKWIKLGVDTALSVASGNFQSVLGELNGDISGGGGTPDVSSNINYDMSDSGDYSDFGGGLATGGPVRTGKHYLVGERGPELFRSATAGHIIDHETTKRMARAGMLPRGVSLPNAAPRRLTPRADGGDVSAGDSYIVGERGAETFMPNLAADQGSRRTEGNGGNVAYYTIDARGTDPNLVEQRVRIAIVQAHKSAIATSIQGNVERSKRVPG